MTQPEALRLADALQQQTVWEGHYGPSYLRDLLPEAAAELRRLHAENEALREANEAFGKRQEWWNERMFALEQQRDALLEALKKAEENGCATVYSNEYDECGAKGCCGVVSYKPHADDCWVTTARAAIKALEEEA